MKTNIQSLDDLKREKEKARKQIAVQEYAIRMQTKEIKHKLSFASLSAIAIDSIKSKLVSLAPGMTAGLVSSLVSRFRSMRKKRTRRKGNS
ncbi:MAG: hypothetical protein HXX13_05690 [Bacteroidetes bacterium]|nr:hypothetical protein [Bacteroidota bacterium]